MCGTALVALRRNSVALPRRSPLTTKRCKRVTGLVAENETEERLVLLSNVRNARGSLLLTEGQWDNAAAEIRMALDIRSLLAHRSPSNAEIQRLLANTRMNLGAVHRNRGEFNDALEAFQQAAAAQETLLAGGRLNERMERLVMRDRGMALYNAANAEFDALRAADLTHVRQLLRDAEAIFHQLLKTEPDSYSDRRRVILCRQLLAEFEADPVQAVVHADEAGREMKKLVLENPALPALASEWAQLRILAGRLCLEAGQVARAIGYFDSVSTTGQIVVSARDSATAAAEAALCAVDAATEDSAERLAAATQLLQQCLAKNAADEELQELLAALEARAGNVRQ